MQPQVPIVKFIGPAKDDQALIELHDTTSAAYIPLDLGTPYGRTREFPSYRLGKQFNLPNDHKWMVRVWIKDEPDSTFWNWVEKFSGDANACPIFVRTYREPRKTYAPLTKGLPLKSLYKLTLATAGTGYTPGTLPALTFNNGGTGGTGAVGHALVNPDGTIAALVLDDGGDGYNTAPTFTIAAPPSGTTATGTAVIQPATALLVAEEAQQYPEDSEFHADFLSVTRIFETLPGPNLPYTRFDDDLGPVQGYRQAVLWNNQAAELTATGKTTYEARDGSSIVVWKIVEAWSDGSGGAGNPDYPSWEWTEFERDGVKKVITRQLKPIADIVTDETLSAGELVREFSERYNEFLAFQITETITVIDGALLDQPSFTTSIPNLIPEIFRAEIPTRIESHIEEGTAAETALATGEFEHSERQLTPLYKEVRSTILDDIGSLPITVTGQKETNEKKQVVSVTMTLELDSTTPTAPNEVRDVDFKKLGNGLAIEIVRTVPDVFPEDSYTKSILNLIPEKFRAAIPLVETTIDSPGSPSTDPTLLTGEFSRTEGRLTEFTKRVRVTSLGTVTLPVVIAGGKETDDKKQVVSVVYTLEADSATPTVPTATRDVEFVKLGNGMAVETVRTVPEVFPEDSYTKSILNLIPEKFRGLIPLTESTVDSAGSPSTDPTLLTGEFSRTEGRITEYTKRVRITKLGTISLPVSITDTETNDQKQIVSVIHTLNVTGSSTAVPTALIDVSVIDLGNGYEVETLRTVADIFDPATFTTSIPNLIPEIFRGLIPLHTEIHFEEGTASEPSLGTGEFSRSEKQLNEFVKEVRFEVLDDIGTLPITVTGIKETNAQKQVVTVAMKLCAEATTPTVPTALIDVDFRKLGNGLAIEITRTVPSVFSAARYSKDLPETVPLLYRDSIPDTVTESDAAGTASMPSVGAGELGRTEVQRDSFIRRLIIRARAALTLPITRYGQDYDQSLDVVIPYERRLEASGTSLGDNRTEVTPISSTQDDVKEVDSTALAAALDAFYATFPGTTNLRLPDTLLGIECRMEYATGNGDFDESGSFTGINPGFSMSIRGTGQGSASIIPNLFPNIQENRADHVPTTHHLFYLPSPVTVADIITAVGADATYPKFKPRAHTFVCVGRRASVRAEATAQSHTTDIDQIGSEGHGYSIEIETILRDVHISPTIHGIIDVSGTVLDFISATADASADTGLHSDTSSIGTGDLYAYPDPIGIPATSDDFEIPATGVCLLDSHCELAGRLNYVRVHAETFDWADV